MIGRNPIVEISEKLPEPTQKNFVRKCHSVMTSMAAFTAKSKSI